MSNQGMRKECKLCGVRFGQGIKLCPNCGSSDIKLVAQENMEFLKTVSTEDGKVEQIGSGKKQLKKKWKKVVFILGAVLLALFVLLIVASQLIIRWADKTVQKEKWEIEETVKTVIQYDGEMTDEKWEEKIFPLLDELYLWQMDEELVEMFEHALATYRPIYDWEHYLYASCLADFYVVKDIWKYEQTGESLKDYQCTELLYYCLEYRNFENREGLTTEEKERLQRYVTNLCEDVTKRWNLTEEDLDNLYAKATKEFGYVDYFVVEEFLKEKDDIVQEEEFEDVESLEEALKRTESLYGVDWQKAMRPILNQLYEQNQYKMLYDIYVDIKSQDTNKPISHWEHYLFLRALYDIYDIEKVLEIEAAGEQIKEWQYVNILMDYFTFEDFENRINLTEEEKGKLRPLVIKLREDAISRWDLSEEEWGALRKSVVSEYNVVSYEKTERFVESWMEKNGYINNSITIVEEIENSIDMDRDTWEKRFYPKLDKVYEQGEDDELYNAVILAIDYGRSDSLVKWQHHDYVDMLWEYYNAEYLWNDEEEGRELDKYDYTNLLYTYLLFEYWEKNKSLSPEEMEKLKPYREKVLQDGVKRWNFTKEEWNELIPRDGYIYYSVVADFIEQWVGNK